MKRPSVLSAAVSLAIVPVMIMATTTMSLALSSTCTSVGACVFADNTGSGPGVEAKAVTGFGVNGVSTKSFGVVGRTLNGQAGVFGIDSNSDNSRYSFGVAGVSTVGTGVLGESVSNNAIEAITTRGYALIGQTSANYGLVSFITGSSSYGAAVYGATLGDRYSTALMGVAYNGTKVFVGSNGTHDVASIDGSGNMILAGTLTENGTPLVRTASEDGQQVATFGVRSSSPTLEDMGEGQLVSGRATVNLDPAFASTIDPPVKYLGHL